MTDTADSADQIEVAEAPRLAWRALAGAAIGGCAIVIAALLGIGAIKSDGSSGVRTGIPGGGPGGQLQFPGPQGQGPGGRVFGQIPPPPPFMQQQQTGRTTR